MITKYFLAGAWQEREMNQGKRNVGRMRQQQIQDPQIHEPNNSNQE
jgi:hypothetical protein